MTFEIQARYKGDDFPVLLRTDDRERARRFATVLRGNIRCADILVIIGHKQFTYDEFLAHLETP